MNTTKKAKARYHGQDLEAAKRRAREIHGIVVCTLLPNTITPRGYWSDVKNSLGKWERIIVDYSLGCATETMVEEAERVYDEAQSALASEYSEENKRAWLRARENLDKALDEAKEKL